MILREDDYSLLPTGTCNGTYSDDEQLYELGKTRGYGPMNAILATSPFFFLDKVIFILLV